MPRNRYWNGVFEHALDGIEAVGERGQVKVITAKVPLSEMFGFTTQLRSLTEGRAVPNLEFSHYAIVPRNVADEVIASRK